MCVCLCVAQFKCCGLEGYQDWGLVIPDSCLCEGEDKSTGCVSRSHLKLKSTIKQHSVYFTVS